MMTIFYISGFIMIVCSILGVFKLIIDNHIKAKKELLDDLFTKGEISINTYTKRSRLL